MNKSALFLDRDGIINIDTGYVHEIEKFIFTEEIFLVCEHAQRLGLQIVVITNQAGIGRGYYTEIDYHILNTWMLKEFNLRGINITDVFYCPYHPVHGIGKYKKDSECRKPKPGMLLEAANRYCLDLNESCLIGDQFSDIEAGKAAGLKHLILCNDEIKHNHHRVHSVKKLLGAIPILNDIYKANVQI